MKKLPFLPLVVIAFLCGCSDRLVFPPETGPRDWIDQQSNTTVDLVGVQFIDRNIGWALGDFDTIVATTDGGATWTPYFYGRMSLTSFHFTDRNNGWGIGRDGILMRTVDGGRSWSRKEYDTIFSAGWVRDIFFVDYFNGWFVADRGAIYRTGDGGETWSRIDAVTQPDFDDLQCVRFVDPFNGWIVGARQIGLNHQTLVLRTNDGGMTWEERVLPVSSPISLCFIDYFNGWFSTIDRRIMRTTNGGASWDETAVGFGVNVLSLQFIDPLNGWAVLDLPNVMGGGEEYDLLSGSTDGGEHWRNADRTMNLQKRVRLSDLHFTDSTHGWAVGDNGAIWHTTTSGRSIR